MAGLMGKSLVIVESPAKAKTINKYLGKDFVVKSSVGHIRDLPAGGGARTASGSRRGTDESSAGDAEARRQRQLVRRMGIDPAAGWRADYQVLPGKEKEIGR